MVVGAGAIAGSGGRPSLGLSILATALVAVAFQPVRERAQRFANRLVYGGRATPYEALSQLSERMASTYASEDLLPSRWPGSSRKRPARRGPTCGCDPAASSATVASWPADAEPRPAIALPDGSLPAESGAGTHCAGHL